MALILTTMRVNKMTEATRQRYRMATGSMPEAPSKTSKPGYAKGGKASKPKMVPYKRSSKSGKGNC